MRRHALAAALVAALVAAAALHGADALAAAAAKKKKAAAAAAAAAASGDVVQVTCGSAVKLTHAATAARLHSHEVGYGSGSGQQSVTAVQTDADAGSIWLVKPALSSPCTPGAPLKSGDVVRMQHAGTRRWLHSHHFPSPLSRAQEVSCFGHDGQSDRLDEWVLDVDAATWRVDAAVRFKHVETGAWLSASGRGYGHPIAGHMEVVGASDKKGAEWRAGEGVYVVGRDA